MPRTGRPLKEIDKKQFENLCKIQCTREEICGWFECCEETINSWCKRTYGMTFLLVFEQKRQGGKISLRRSQWKLSKDNTAMAIWLGKQYLGQREPDRDAITEHERAMQEKLNKIDSKLNELSIEELRAIAKQSNDD